MTYEIGVVLLLLVAAMVAFVRERLPVDVIALGLVAAVVILGILTPQEAFSGFSNDVIIVLCSVFVLAGALARNGVVAAFADAIHRFAGRGESRVVVTVMSVSAAMSSFINNTTSTAILMPAVVELARRRELSPSRFLIPLAYASMLGGAGTLIGTSTNLAASGLMQRVGLEPIGMFELLPAGLTMALIGVAYMSIVGYRWLPSRAEPALLTEFEIDSYLSRIVVSEEADLVGSALRETWLADEGISVLAIERDGAKLFPRADSRIEAGDALIVKASRQGLLELGDRPGAGFAELEWTEEDELVGDDVRLAEAIIMPRSRLLGRTLRQLRLRQRYGVSVLAIYRHGVSHPVEIADLPLAEADVLLLQGGEEGLALLQSNESVWVIGIEAPPPGSRGKRLITVGAFAAGVAAATLGLLPVAVAMLLAALIVVATRCIEPDEIYGAIDWRVIVLIGGMTSFGLAMEASGTADYLAARIVVVADHLGTYGLLAAFALLTMVLTQPLSNAAAVLVVMPVAVSAAASAGIDPRPLAILVALSASFSFIAPLEPSCLLVYSAGHYRFSDFVKAGIPLTAIAFAVLLLLVPWLWPLAPAGQIAAHAPESSGSRNLPVEVEIVLDG